MIARKFTFLLSTLFFIAGCPNQQDYAKALTGSWTGKYEGARWCLTLLKSGTSTVGEGAANYRTVYDDNGELVRLYSSGVWLVGIGGRLQINLNPWTLDEALNAVPPTELRTTSVRYLVKSLHADELVYRELNSNSTFGKTFTSRRIDSCEGFFKQAD